MPEVTPGSGPEPRGDRHGCRGGLGGGRAERGQFQALDHRVAVRRGPFWLRRAGPDRQRLTAQQVDGDGDVDLGQRGGRDWGEDNGVDQPLVTAPHRRVQPRHGHCCDQRVSHAVLGQRHRALTG